MQILIRTVGSRGEVIRTATSKASNLWVLFDLIPKSPQEKHLALCIELYPSEYEL